VTNDDGMDDDCWSLSLRSLVEVGMPTTTNHRWEHCRRVGGSSRKEQRGTKKRRTMSTRSTCKKEEDDDKNEEEDCAAAAAAATAADATAVTTTGLHTSSVTTVSDQAVAAAAAARHSGLQRGMVAVAADSRMPSLPPVFVAFLTECVLHMAHNTMFLGSFPPDSGRIPGSGGFRNKLILPWND